MKKLTVEMLAQALDESFEDDGWGTVDPYLLKEVIEPVEHSCHTEDAEALRKVLQRTIDRLEAMLR